MHDRESFLGTIVHPLLSAGIGFAISQNWRRHLLDSLQSRDDL